MDNPQKNLVFLFLISTSIFFLSSCDDEQERSRGLRESGNCHRNGWVVNDARDACLCPEETHIELPLHIGIPDDDLPLCMPKNNTRYFFTATESCCLRYGTFKGYNDIGLATFSFPRSIGTSTVRSSLELTGGDGNFEYTNGSIFNSTWDGTSDDDFALQEQPDGSFSVHFIGPSLYPERCPNLVSGNLDCVFTDIKVETTGQSNIDRSEVDLTLVWKDCDGVAVDTGYIHMWKEW